MVVGMDMVAGRAVFVVMGVVEVEAVVVGNILRQAEGKGRQ